MKAGWVCREDSPCLLALQVCFGPHRGKSTCKQKVILAVHKPAMAIEPRAVSGLLGVKAQCDVYCSIFHLALLLATTKVALLLSALLSPLALSNLCSHLSKTPCLCGLLKINRAFKAMEFTYKHLHQNFSLVLGCDTSTVNAEWKAPTNFPVGIPWLCKDLGFAV